jgi:acyl-CoA thioesterase I
MRLVLLTMMLAGTVWAQTGSQTSAATPPQTTAQTDAAKQIAAMEKKLDDWPQLGRYRAANAALPPVAAGEKRVVFYGDSITDAWAQHPDWFFPGKPYVGRGISGQTTPQMLVRFQQDVVHLKPAAVVILAGTNDIAGNTGPSTPEMIEDNFESMVEIAKTNNIKVVLASILPADHYSWKPGVEPAEQIRAMNQRLKALAAREGLVYLDYYTTMVNEHGGLDPELAKDGVHPTEKGYAIMAPLAEKAIAEALAKSQ